MVGVYLVWGVTADCLSCLQPNQHGSAVCPRLLKFQALLFQVEDCVICNLFQKTACEAQASVICGIMPFSFNLQFCLFDDGLTNYRNI
jgi:hypothetical protein